MFVKHLVVVTNTFRLQHPSPTFVTNIDVATISIRPIMCGLNSGIRNGQNFLCGRFQKFGTDSVNHADSGDFKILSPIPWEIDFEN